MSGIFISYRRDDARGYAGRLYDRLIRHFGQDQVFRDIDRIEPGKDFAEAIDQSIASCDALLVLIGGEWLTIADENGRRLHDPNDFVRLEVAKALQRGVPVIPVLIPGADQMPEPEDLPEDLSALSRRQAIKVREETWRHDVGRLTTALEKIGLQPNPWNSTTGSASTEPDSGSSKKPWILAAVVGLVAVIGLVAGGAFESGDSRQEQQQPPPAVPENNLVQDDPEEATGSDDQALLAQSLLASLQYDPGPIDGRPGGLTRRVVRQFQRDHGLSATGQIDTQLIEQLREAVAAGEVAPQRAQPVDSAPIRTQTPPPSDFSGRWYDDAGGLYKLKQRGRVVTGSGYEPGTGETTPVIRFRGTVTDAGLSYTFATVFGDSGAGQGTLEPDGQHMAFVSTDSATGLVSYGRLHLGHRP